MMDRAIDSNNFIRGSPVRLGRPDVAGGAAKAPLQVAGGTAGNIRTAETAGFFAVDRVAMAGAAHVSLQNLTRRP